MGAHEYIGQWNRTGLPIHGSSAFISPARRLISIPTGKMLVAVFGLEDFPVPQNLAPETFAALFRFVV